MLRFRRKRGSSLIRPVPDLPRALKLSPAVRYGIALLTVAAATGVRLGLDEVIGNQFPFAAFYLPIVVTAWLGGFGPAAVATLLSMAVADLRYLTPEGGIIPDAGDAAVGLALFAVSGLAIALLGGWASAVAVAKLADQQAQQLEQLNAHLEERVLERTASLASANESLRASEERFRSIVEGVGDYAIFVLDLDGVIRTWNSGAVAVFGYEPEEILGKPLSEIFPPEASDEARSVMVRVAHERQVAVEGWRRRKDGSRLWASGTLVALRGSGDRLSGFVEIVRDRTRKRRDDQIIRSVLESTLDGIVSIDEHGTVLSFNPAAERLFGRAAGEVIGHNVSLLMPGPVRGEHDGYLERYVRTGEARIVGGVREVEGLRSDGVLLPLELAVTEFELDGRRHFVGIFHDVRDRKLLELQLRHSQRLEAVGQLAGGVAHDFNNLLTVILGYGEHLRSSGSLVPGGLEAHAADAIWDAAQRAAALTRQLLAFSRQTVLAPQALVAGEVVSGIEGMLRRLIGEDVELVTSLADDDHQVRVDGDQLGQVLVNLAVNARDAMPVGGRLTIATTVVALSADEADAVELAAGRYVVLTFADTGEGMPPDVQEHAFEPFFTTKPAGEGTGLGLSTVYGIVQQSGGRLSVESEVGVGTTFTIHLPCLEAATTAPVEVGHEDRSASVDGLTTILLVEDQPDLRQLAALTLATSGFSVLDAGSGAEALRLVEESEVPVDLLLTDVVMPEMSGRELAEILTRHRPELPVLFMSGYNDDAVLRNGLAHADVDLLQKPFTPGELISRVRQALATEPREAR